MPGMCPAGKSILLSIISPTAVRLAKELQNCLAFPSVAADVLDKKKETGNSKRSAIRKV